MQELNSLSQSPFFKNTETFKCLQRSPLGFIDVGARGGVHDYVLPIASLTNVVGFEPDEAECKRLLQSPNAKLWAEFNAIPFALSDKPEDKTLHLLSASTNHSLLPPNPLLIERYHMQKNWSLIGEQKLATVTLDAALLVALPHFYADFIKLDTQGTEYEILLGAVETITKQTTAIVCEVSFCELYQGQKLFSEIELFLRENKFSFYGFMPIHTRSKKLLDKKSQISKERALYADAVFFKDPLSMIDVNLDKRQVTALFTVALLLGYYDFALELAMEMGLAHDETEKQHIASLINHFSAADPVKTRRSVQSLLTDIEKDSSMTNVLVGSFVDKRRAYCDYDDILNVSPLPVSYE